MPADVSRCPQCNRLVQVPAELFGQLVQCPGCGSTFTAGAAPSPAGVASGVPRRDAPRYDDEEPDHRRRSRSREEDYDDEYEGVGRRRSRSRPEDPQSKINGPAIGLIVTAILGMVSRVVSIIINLVQMGMTANQGGPMAGRGGQEEMQMFVMFTGTLGIVTNLIALLASVVVLLGALKMKKLESYGFAMAASILAIIPIISPCCYLGLPMGIWALVILNQPEVKEAFR